MTDTTLAVLEKVHHGLGQGSLLEQIDKVFRKQQRINLFEKLGKVDKEDLKKHPVDLYKSITQNGIKQPVLLRFSLPFWKGHDEIFWQALGDYVILALHRVKDVSFDSDRCRLKVEYFQKIKGRIKHPEEIKEIVQKLAYLIDVEALPTDFTRFRRMTERRGSLGEMSKEQAALIGAALKLIEI